MASLAAATVNRQCGLNFLKGSSEEAERESKATRKASDAGGSDSEAGGGGMEKKKKNEAELVHKIVFFFVQELYKCNAGMSVNSR